MGALGGLYRGRNDINFPKLWKPVLTVSVVLVIASIVSLFVSGLNLAIDFDGGASWEIPSKTLTVANATSVLEKFNLAEGAKVQQVTDSEGHRTIRVQADLKDIKKAEKVADAYATATKQKVANITTNTVGPSWGKEITSKALRSLIIFLGLVALYIAWQLEWRMALAALVGVAHDIILTVGIYSIFKIEVTPATVISFLTILGYSLYDTIVVYDRLQENSIRFDRGGSYTYTAVMRRSLNQVLMRSINTTAVSLLPVASMLVVGAAIFDQPVLKDFSLALFIGLFSGAYSSIFVASPLLAFLKEREPKYRRIRQRAIERGELEAAEHMPVDVGTGLAAQAIRRAATVASTGPAAAVATTTRAHPPRPRKQGRKR